MLVSPLPSWKQLFCIKQKRNAHWDDTLWLSGSGISLRLIIQAYKDELGKNDIDCWIPDYFCAETECEFLDDNIRIFRYPIDCKFEPAWDLIKRDAKNINVDIFVFVHYFGEFHDISKARVLCDQKKAILIEDCAHVLYQNNKIGQKGDFVLYSPHKFLPVPDGAYIKINPCYSMNTVGIYERLRKHVISKKAYLSIVLIWSLKKIVQKIIKIRKPINYEYKEHYLDTHNSKNLQIQISKYSSAIIQAFSYEDLKRIGYIRHKNLILMNYLLENLSSDIIPIITSKNECPFFAVYSMRDVSDPEKLVKNIQSLGIPVLFWPSLPNEVSFLDHNNCARKLSRDLIVVPIHQGISGQNIAKRIHKKADFYSRDLSVRKVLGVQQDVFIWDQVLKNSGLSNITQDWAYGEAKAAAHGWRVERYIITRKLKNIGVVQVLCKYLLGIPLVTRINKGPIFINSEQTIENELTAVNLIKKEQYRYSPMIYAPFCFLSGENYSKIISLGWWNFNQFGFPSGTIDLERSEEEFRASLDGKWRNQLKTATKHGHIIKTGLDRVNYMLSLYEQDQNEKGFVGVDKKLLLALFSTKNSPMRVFYIENTKREIIAFDIFYKHSNMATYYIGWNSDEGRKDYLNNFLLFNSALLLKKEGVVTLDLGGIDYIHTENIAKFKDGMNPKHYQHMGEFFRI
jgi:dTDP-4-amino-4,6-dideoxygalactose transaminase